MKIEIDQSGKIEATQSDTVIADSLGNHICFRSIGKQVLQTIYREQKRPRVFVYEVFSALTAVLIRKTFHKTNQYIVDIEYFNQDDYLRSLIASFLRKLKMIVDPAQISFGRIGKNSKAHATAYQILTNKRIKRIYISSEKLLTILKPIKRDRVLSERLSAE